MPSVVVNTGAGICVRMAKNVIRQTAGFRKFEYYDSSANILPSLTAQSLNNCNIYSILRKEMFYSLYITPKKGALT